MMNMSATLAESALDQAGIPDLASKEQLHRNVTGLCERGRRLCNQIRSGSVPDVQQECFRFRQSVMDVLRWISREFYLPVQGNLSDPGDLAGYRQFRTQTMNTYQEVCRLFGEIDRESGSNVAEITDRISRIIMLLQTRGNKEAAYLPDLMPVPAYGEQVL